MAAAVRTVGSNTVATITWSRDETFSPASTGSFSRTQDSPGSSSITSTTGCLSGGSGNCFAPSLVEVGNNVMLYHNDEPGRGSHRWRAEGLSDIRELTANITVGQAPTGTTNTPSSGITNTIGGGGLSTNGGSGSTLPTISVAATTQAAEGGATGVFTFTRSGSTTGALTVNFTVGGTATAGSDYASIGNSVSFPAGTTNNTVNV